MNYKFRRKLFKKFILNGNPPLSNAWIELCSQYYSVVKSVGFSFFFFFNYIFYQIFSIFPPITLREITLLNLFKILFFNQHNTHINSRIYFSFHVPFSPSPHPPPPGLPIEFTYFIIYLTV